MYQNGLSSPNTMKLFNCHPIWQGKMTAIRVQSFQLHFGQSFSPSDYAEHSLKGRWNWLKKGVITGQSFWKDNYFLIMVTRAILHSLTRLTLFGQTQVLYYVEPQNGATSHIHEWSLLLQEVQRAQTDQRQRHCGISPKCHCLWWYPQFERGENEWERVDKEKEDFQFLTSSRCETAKEA